MTQRIRRSILGVSLVAATLSLAGPLEAGGRETARGPAGILERALAWINASWIEVWSGQPHQAVSPDTAVTRRGSGIDPNGGDTGAPPNPPGNNNPGGGN